MTWYLAAEYVGELAEYPVPVRRLVVQRAVGLLRHDSKWAAWLPPLLSVFGSLLGVTGALLAVGHIWGHRPLAELIPTTMLCDWAGGVIGWFGGGFIGLQLQIPRLRPLIQKALKDFIDETVRRI